MSKKLPSKALLNQISNFSSGASLPKVLHDPVKKLFYQECSGSTSKADRAVLLYEKMPCGGLDLYHTEVPEKLRGGGLAANLAKAAFDYCTDNKLKMKLTCSYLQRFYKMNPLPQYTELAILP